jgi:hypothetical protein
MCLINCEFLITLRIKSFLKECHTFYVVEDVSKLSVSFFFVPRTHWSEECFIQVSLR